MPGSMDGVKLTAAVRNRWPPIHVVITTGKNNGRGTPPDTYFLSKSYRADSLLGMLRGLE